MIALSCASRPVLASGMMCAMRSSRKNPRGSRYHIFSVGSCLNPPGARGHEDVIYILTCGPQKKKRYISESNMSLKYGFVLPTVISIFALGLLGLGLSRPKSSRNSRNSQKPSSTPDEPQVHTSQTPQPAPATTYTYTREAEAPAQQSRKGSYDNVPPYEPVKSST